MKSKDILIVLAHPDDCELKCYGTLRKYLDAGYTANLLLLCGGENGIALSDQNNFGDLKILDSLRVKETNDALKKVNMTIETLSHSDGNLVVSRELIVDIEKRVKKYKPEIVITHFFDPMGVDHQDHSAVAKATINCVSRAGFVKKVLLCEPLMTLRSGFIPNYYVDITSYIKDKVEALSMHKSQAGRFYLEKEYQECKARYYASSVSFEEGKNEKSYEAFQLLFARE